MKNEPALRLGFGNAWACWTGWICFSLLNLFRSCPLLKPKEFKGPAGDCAPPHPTPTTLPCPSFYLLFFFFKQWGLFADKHLLEQSVLAFKIASAREWFIASEDYLFFFISRQASSGMSACDCSLQRYCHTNTAVCCLLQPPADMHTWCHSPDHWCIPLRLFVHQTIIPWSFLLLFLVVGRCFCFVMLKAEPGLLHMRRGNITIRLHSQPSALQRFLKNDS